MDTIKRKKLLSSVTIQYHDDMYKVVSELNHTLKDRGLIFGLSLNKQEQTKATLSIYEG
ncbi:YpmA family protein [Shouchella lonarensis]|uniref:DUF4264 domain-containing protein n=1 Tax=Shouchella lonarensis TaxID=1464122 RepID=A0A1G6HCP3_9BACI|nr:YpmA family protein [Shouchella lonarensis]SDB91206.1 Protein of unknown function [Shouchella lonarensis]